jgi:hypothetical protein
MIRIVLQCKGKGTGKAIPLQAYYRPRGLQEVEAHWQMKVVTSALRTGRLHPLGNIPSTHFC